MSFHVSIRIFPPPRPRPSGPGGRASLAGPARAQNAKAGPAEALYQDNPKGQQRCDICLNFEDPDQCRLVEGPISPKGWCQFFAARENAR